MKKLKNRDSNDVEGWVWDIYSKEEGITIWVKTRDGGCIRFVDRWRPSIYVSAGEDDLNDLSNKPWIADRCEYTRKLAGIRDHKKSTVLRIHVRDAAEGRLLAKRITRLGNYVKYRLYNVDVPAAQLYMYEKDLFPLAYVKATEFDGHIEWRMLDNVESNTYETPRLNCMALKVEAKSSRVPSFNEPVLRIHLKFKKELTIDSGSEIEKLGKLVKNIQRIDPDIVLTEGGNRFIFPYLVYRSYVNDFSNDFVLGREKMKRKIRGVKGRVYSSYGRVYYKPRSFRLLGRLHIDLEDSMIYSDRGLQSLMEIARVCRIPIQRAADSSIGTCMSSLQFYEAVKRDLLIPWMKSEPEDFKTARELLIADRGGFCFEPKVGVHGNIGEIDFDSLYPTIMAKHNLSPESINCNCCSNSDLRVPEVGYQICKRKRGLIPIVIELLLKKRRAYKQMRNKEADPNLKRVWDERQASLKWILVTSFGYLGYRNARFGRIEAHIATCAFARDALWKAFHLAERRGFKVLHGIVDSLWLKKEGAGEEDYRRLCREISEKLGLPVSFKGIYRWIAFPPSKVNEGSPVINRYYGVFEDGRFKARGVELRKRDTPGIIRRCQEEMLKELAKAEGPEQVYKLVPAAVKILRRYVEFLLTGKAEAKHLTIKKRLSKDPEMYGRNVLQAVAARQLKTSGAQLSAGQEIEYVITDADNSLPNNRVRNMTVSSNRMIYDRQKYIELLLSSAVDLFSPLGYSKTKLKSLIVS